MGDLVSVVLWDAEPLGASGTLTSVPLSNHAMDAEALLLHVTSALGNADVKVEMALAEDGAGTFGPTTAQDPLVASTATEYAGSAEERHSLVLPAAPVFRLVVTELTGSVADTLVSATALFRTRP